MKKIIVSIIVFASIPFFSQNYTPIDTADGDKRNLFIKIYEEKNKQFVADLKNKYVGKEGKELKNFFEDFSKDFSKEIKEGKFIFNEKLSAKVLEILNELRKNNPIIPNDLRILLAKNGSLNAYCTGDGTFVVNLGLFYWLNNEDQIASVISHELGHKILSHNVKTVYEKIKDENSATTKQTIKKLKNKKYNRNETAFSVLKSKMYDKSIKNRKKEIEADFLGYVIFKNSKYNKFEYVEALKLMEQYDTIKPKGLNVEIYKKMFNLPTLPFKEKWMEKEDFSSYDYSLYKDKLDKDSLASHPETDERIKKLKELFVDLQQENYKSVEGDASFKELERISEYEIVPNLYFNENYGAGIYTCLYFLQLGKNDTFYKEWLGKCFTKIYEARKKYTLNRYLDRVEPKEQSESYQQFLNFMWNLSLSDIENIKNYYANPSNF